MPVTAIPSEPASIAEVVAALDALTPEDLLRLRQLAKLRSSALVVMDWEDLLNEAIQRALEGVRQWPRLVPFMAFMVQTMRSIASEERRERQANLTVSEVDLVSSDSSTLALDQLTVNEVDPAREIEAREFLSNIESMFASDEDALAVLRGFALGLTPNEIRESNGLTATQYATTQRRIRRALARL